ncbi:hypothetical protein [uncultured Campylobacter sp.]|uniref:hypothetical protein n=1 Tax=uncultured Campylobacter sp. TaxID=218934 RepID=UPI002601CA30|nr:hypothetical protein [uncultured Campylobacter sp.]
MNAMKFIKIYAASVHNTMRQVRRQTASRSLRALTASLSRKILSAPFQSGFERGISDAKF